MHISLLTALLFSAMLVTGTAMFQSDAVPLTAEALSKLRAWANQSKTVGKDLEASAVALQPDINELFTIGKERTKGRELTYNPPGARNTYHLYFAESGAGDILLTAIRGRGEVDVYLTDSTRKLRAWAKITDGGGGVAVPRLMINAEGVAGYQDVLRVWAGLAARPHDQFH